MSLDRFEPLEINGEDYISAREMFASGNFPLLFGKLKNSR